MAISEVCEAECGLCATLGCLRPTSMDMATFDRELDSIELCSPREIVLPPNSIDHPDSTSMVREIRDRGMKPIVRVRPAHLIDDRDIISALEYKGAKFELVVDRPLSAKQIDALDEYANHIESIVVVLNREIDSEAVAEVLQSTLTAPLSLLAPVEIGERFFSPDEIFHLRSESEILRSLPSAGHLQGRTRFLETGVHASTRFTSSPSTNDRIRLSVAIPFRRGISNLELTLAALGDQDFDPSRFEILVVTDRSDETDIEAIETWMKSKPLIATTLLVLEETGTRAEDFRAGLARNAGAFHARGSIVVFLDSDAVAPKGFLADVDQAHSRSDVVQYRRLDDKNDQESYWEDFYESEDWMNLRDRWKYVSTFALTVKLSDFLKVGGFSPAFDRYGCEDTQLGWNFDRLGRRFELRPMTVTHVGGRVRLRRESSRAKMKRLAPMARALYLTTLDEDVYRTFFTALGRFNDLRWFARTFAGVGP